MWRTIGLLVFLLGCDDGARSRSEGESDPADDRGVEDPDAGVSDRGVAEPSPDTDPSPEPEPSPEGCRIDVQVVPTAQRGDHEPLVDGDTVYFSEAGPDGGWRTVRARDRAPVGGPSDRLLAARGGAFLLARPDGDGGRRLIYRDAAGDVPLAERLDWPYGPVVIDWRPPQWVEPGRAVFIEGRRLYGWSGGEVTLLAEGVIAATERGGHRAWVVDLPDAQPPAQEVWLDGQRAWREPEAASGRAILRAEGSNIWYAVGDRVVRLPVDGSPASVHDLGGGVGDLVLALEVGSGVAYVTMQMRDGVRLRRIADAVTDLQVAPLPIARPAGGGLALAQWDDAQGWCDAAAFGALRWAPLGDDGPMLDAAVGSGCLCCGAYWPRFTMEASPTTLAWNYAVTDDGAPAIGIARLICD